MKKCLKYFCLIFLTITIFTETSWAVLTNTAPSKYKNVQIKPNTSKTTQANSNVDFGPYMRELQRKIKMNWEPPKGTESKRVVMLFTVKRNGALLSSKIVQSSGIPAVDQAAQRAVQLTAPFRPLPSGFNGNSVDIQFTFDYNVNK